MIVGRRMAVRSHARGTETSASAGRRLSANAAALAIALAALLLVASPTQAQFGFLTKWGAGGSNDGQFLSPHGVATDPAGNVYVADEGNARIQKFDSSGRFLTMWGWGVDTGASELETCAPATLPCQRGIAGHEDGQFHHPRSVATDPAGNVYVTQFGGALGVQKFTSDGAFLTRWGRGDGQFARLPVVATDPAGNVYVADVDASLARVQKFTSNGVFLTRWGSRGSGDGQFIHPKGIATDASNNVYVSNSDFRGDTDRIQKFTSNGAFITKWGTFGSGNGQFDDPAGVATDPTGGVYVADEANHRIQKFGPNGAFIRKWGSEGFGDGQFDHPWGVATDAAGNVYVADAGNHRIQKFGPGGTPVNGGSNRFSLGKVNLNRKRGIARLIARVPGPGRVILRQTKQVRRAARQVESAGRTRLPVRPRGKAQRRISSRRCQRSGKKRLAVRVMARVTYRPADGEPQTQQRRVRLVKRC